MPQDGTEHRKLAAIMFTDMVGYSTLVERNEALALELLEEHQRLLRKRTYVQPTYLGFVHASLGNHDEAFACFAQGLEHENGNLAYLGEYCIFASLDRLRADARFPALLKKSESKRER
jgi:tetratricopeptide (TPR) repeat protein